jgi:hypothetical protein
MNPNVNHARSFLKVLRNELQESIIFYLNKEKLIFEYSGITITLLPKTDTTSEVDFVEKDIVDALCRMRLLVVEKYNRNFPNTDRHWAYKDLELEGLKIEQPSIYLTDNKKLFLISF